jgi:hypothetical protein
VAEKNLLSTWFDEGPAQTTNVSVRRQQIATVQYGLVSVAGRLSERRPCR